MKISILTLFPEMFMPLKTSLIGKATNKQALQIDIIDIRDFSKDKHHNTDDTPCGGGAGMVMMAQPIYDAVLSVKQENSEIYYMSPRGQVFNQGLAKELSKKEHLILICGHYEGIDQRVIDLLNIKELSIGDYVLTGGEIPAMAVVDSIARLVPEVLSEGSAEDESFSSNLLEYPQYTHPREFMGLTVPEVLLSGNHKEVDKWRHEQSLLITKKNRPDLLKK